jgi:hypothetical protein
MLRLKPTWRTMAENGAVGLARAEFEGGAPVEYHIAALLAYDDL